MQTTLQNNLKHAWNCLHMTSVWTTPRAKRMCNSETRYTSQCSLANTAQETQLVVELYD